MNYIGNLKKALSILIIDDHQLFIDGLTCLLEKSCFSFEIIGALSFEEGRRLLLNHAQCDVILLDINQPEKIDFKDITDIKALYPRSKLVLLSDFEDKELIISTINAGLDGCIPKSIGGELLVGALGLVVSGGVYIPKIAVTNHILPTDKPNLQASEVKHASPLKPIKGSVLTKRQLDILGHLAEGSSNKEIARILDISDGTVRIHMSTMYRVLDVQNRTQAVFKAQELGLL